MPQAARGGRAPSASPGDLIGEQVTLDDASAVAHWCGRFECSENDLRKAVSIVGRGALAVQCFLRSGLFA